MFSMNKPKPKTGYDAVLLGLIYDLALTVSTRGALEEEERDPELQKYMRSQEKALLRALSAFV